MKIKIEYSPRESIYVWGVMRDGEQIHWHKGKSTVDATQNEVLAIYRECEFTVSA